MAMPRIITDDERVAQLTLRERVTALLGSDNPLWARSDFSFVDLETTGMDPAVDKIVEIGIVRVQNGQMTELSTLVNPEMEIPPTASAVHHIVDEMVSDAPVIGDIAADIKDFLGDSKLVAFNAAFDSKFLNPVLDLPVNTEKAATNGWICGLRLARHLWPEAPAHNNQVLRYFFKTAPKSAGLGAHRAIDDVHVSLETFRRQLADLTANKGVKSLNEVLAYADQSVKITSVHFGKHKGKDFSEIPADYFEWALGGGMDDLDWDLRSSMEAELATRGKTNAFSGAAAKPAGPSVPATAMTFGKYNGVALGEIPIGYFNFLAEKGVRLTPEMKAGIDIEMALRKSKSGAAPSPSSSSRSPVPSPVQGRILTPQPTPSSRPLSTSEPEDDFEQARLADEANSLLSSIGDDDEDDNRPLFSGRKAPQADGLRPFGAATPSVHAPASIDPLASAAGDEAPSFRARKFR